MRVRRRTKTLAKKIFLFFPVLLFFAGCSTGMKESLRGIAGVSTKVLEDELPKAVSQEFNLSYDTAYSKVNNILQGIKAYIYAVDNPRKLIAVYVSETDTTPVGIFFQEISKVKTRIQVSSPSQYAKELISKKLFTGLEK